MCVLELLNGHVLQNLTRAIESLVPFWFPWLHRYLLEDFSRKCETGVRSMDYFVNTRYIGQQ